MTHVPLKLSLCMIVRNEEAYLEECLRDAREYVDEMIVIDTGSTDRTREIAAAMGAKVGHFGWTGDFSEARNASLAPVTGNWVLVLDADERLDVVNGVRLRHFLETAPEELVGFCVRIESEAQHKNSGVILSHYYPRVFRYEPGVHFAGSLHEQVIHPAGNVTVNLPRLPVVIWHLGYADAAKERARQQRNLSIIEAEARRRPDDVLVRRNLANTLLACGQTARAREMFESLLSADLALDMQRQTRWNICTACSILGEYDRALESLDPDDASQGARLLRAEALRRSGRASEAIAILEALLETPVRPSDRLVDFHAEPLHILLQLASCEKLRGFPSRARARLEDALTRVPDAPEAHFEMGLLDEVAGDSASAARRFARAAELQPFMAHAWNALVRAHTARGDLPAARAALGQGLARVPSDEGLQASRKLLDAAAAVSAAGGSPRRWPGLSVAMIVRNGEPTLRRALESVRGVADEVVIADTGSSDGTRPLAESLGARVISFPWIDDFSAARNAALTAASGEWLLVLDADEALEAGSADALRAFVSSGNWDAGEVGIVNDMREGDTVSRLSHRYCRLFRKREGVAFEGRVHEQVLPSLLRSGARIGPSGVRIRHWGYGETAEVLRAKQERNLRLLERGLSENPGDAFLRFHLGVTLFALGRAAEAREALEAALSGNTLPPEALAMAHVKLAQNAIAAKEYPRARLHLAEARLLRPDSPLVGYIEAGVDFFEGRFAEAAAALERLLRAGEAGQPDEALAAGELHSDLGNCRFRLGDYAGAEAAYAAAVRLRPEAATLAYNLGNSVFRQGRLEESLVHFERAVQLQPALSVARENAAQCRTRLAERWSLEGRLQEVASLSLDAAPRRLRSLVAGARFELGQASQALELLRELADEDPGDAESALLLAAALRRAGRPQESVALFERVVRGTAPDPAVLSQYALALLDAGREEEAGRVFEAACRLDPALIAPPAA